MAVRADLRSTMSGGDGKPLLSRRQIVNMNLGFFGIQFSFGLQQSNMSPIYKYLGAHDATLPYLWLAGPVTGLILQPLIGALSDRTLSPLGRRTPYFLVGALIATLGLLAMPYSPALWVAAGLLWILDAANNVTMEPYRAFVSDRLSRDQHAVGFLMQSAFTGLSQTLAYLMPSQLVLLGLHAGMVNAHGIPYVVVVAFLIGAVFSIGTVGWSAWTTPELPLGAEEAARIRAAPRSPGATVREILDAVREMPPTMRQLALMMLCQWYAMFCYWEYIPLSLARTLFGAADPHSADFTRAVLINGQIGGFYNFLAFLAALAMLPLARRYGARALHVCSLLAGGVGLLALPQVHSHALLFVPMAGLGIAWASMMGNPYTLLADSVPSQRAGVYMGLFNVFIVVPMLLQIVTLPLYYGVLLHGNPQNAVRLAGVLLLVAALLTLRVDRGRRAAAQ